MTEIEKYARDVKTMREAQISYFQARKDGLQTVANDWLRKSKEAEKQVDKRTDEILSGSTQTNLFEK